MSEELQTAPESSSWSEYLSEQLSEVADDQLETESETEEVSEDTNESDEVGEESETEEETETEKPLFDDDTEISLGEDKQPVKLSELKNGYLRQSDYTKKTQLLADERKQFESEKAEYEPVKGWLDYINSNPYLFQQINQAIDEWNKTGVLPLDEVLGNNEAAPYINHLMSEVNRLQKELDQISGEYQTTKFDSDMKALVNDLKAEYGDLIDSEYEQSLITQAKEQGLSTDVLKRIAKGDLAEKKLQQTQQESKKVEAKTKQKIRETKLPPQPKKVGNQPTQIELDTGSDWQTYFKQASGK